VIAAAPLRALARGIRAARINLGPVTWTYLTSLLSAFPLAFGAGVMVHQTYGHSLEAVAFASRLDVSLMAEFLRARGDGLAVYAPLIGGAMLFWCAVSAFLTGAVIMAVSSDEPPRTGDFFSGGGRVFGRLLRLVLFALPFTIVVVGAVGAGAHYLSEWIVEDWVSEKGVITVKLLSVGLTALVLAWVNGAYDLMKVESVAKGEHRARWAFWRGLKRAATHPLQLFAIYLPFVATAIVLTILSSLLDVQLARSSWIMVIVGVILQQGTAFARAALRVGLAAAEVSYVRGAR
jgi:hypothetical protein